MQAPFTFREFQVRADRSRPGRVIFAPVTVKNSPVATLLDPHSTSADADAFRTSFRHWAGENASVADVTRLAAAFDDRFNGAESSVGGPAAPSYLQNALLVGDAGSVAELIEGDLAREPADCASRGVISARNAIERLTALSCAGCHAPAALMTRHRSLGCGLVFPESGGVTHIDEHGELSAAMTGHFLPARAELLSLFLQACDEDAVQERLQPEPPPLCFVAGTPITLADGSSKPIEDVRVGDVVLSYDVARAELAPGVVTETFVHEDSDGLVMINEELVATANHPIFSDGDWVRADELGPGSSLLLAHDVDATDGVALVVGPGEVRQVAALQGRATTYNFEVAVHHDYFAGGVLVHNKK